jgi:hypothetical protein
MATYLVETVIRTRVAVQAKSPEEAMAKAKDRLFLLGRSAEGIGIVEVAIGNLDKIKNEEGAN